MFGTIGLIVGILLILWGIYMIIFFPTQSQIQPENIGITGIIFGFILLAAGIILIFL